MNIFSKQISVLLFAAVIVLTAAAGSALITGDTSQDSPMVEYLSPESDAVVDLAGRDSLTFRWRPVPIPGGNRASYKFELFKGFEYDRVIKTVLSPRVFSIEVSADLFENGAVYTWQVRQRDRNTRNWSRQNRWSFSVKK